MKVIPTEIPDVLIIEPRVFEDERGFFLESYNEQAFLEKANIQEHFVQDNHSRSAKNVLRGLHYQIQQPQGKLVRVVAGEIFDVAVDLRASSKYFGQWVGVKLSAENKQQLWVPAGFAHGFVVISEYAEVLYKTTTYYAPQYERSILWNDPDIAMPLATTGGGIAWPLATEPILSGKDQAGKRLKDAEVYV